NPPEADKNIMPVSSRG
ncbi:hypothetical protein SLEP1_g60042, partial [Rubroshorea leprosula]